MFITRLAYCQEISRIPLAAAVPASPALPALYAAAASRPLANLDQKKTRSGTYAGILAPAISLTLFDDVAGRRQMGFASGRGNVLFLTSSAVLPLFTDGSQGASHAGSSMQAMLASTAFSYGLKEIVRERRPSRHSFDSFPSAHTSVAFAAATAQSAFHPSQAPIWYAGATVIGISRIYLHDHYVWDVAAGAVLGYASARLTLSRARPVSLSPAILDDDRSYGVRMITRF